MRRLFILTWVLSAFTHVCIHAQNGFVVNHQNTAISQIPTYWIEQAKTTLHIAYNHTSHGSQLITGMNAVEAFPSYEGLYSWTDDSQGDTNSLSLKDHGIPGIADLSQGDQDGDNDGIDLWAEDTYEFLDNPDNYHINVVMWSWCNIAGHDIDRYLNSMEWLIGQFGEGGTHPRATEHPVQFVFMTAHANGGGEGDSSDIRNQQIREHVIQNNRILFDFSDIENFDPDDSTGVPDSSENPHYYLDKRLDDALYYDNEPPYDSGSRDGNWAVEYLDVHNGEELYQLVTGDGVEGYNGCQSCAHSNGPDNLARLNCILKGRAAWYLFARLAGWNGNTTGTDELSVDISGDFTAYPNPAHSGITLKYNNPEFSSVKVYVYDLTGKSVFSRSLQKLDNEYSCHWDTTHVDKGVYIAELVTPKTKKHLKIWIR